MRIDANNGANTLHYHTGGSCHGASTLEACAKEAIKNGDIGRILERTDTHADEGDKVKCYSMIVNNFAHWAKHGRFVAVIELTMRML